MTVSVLRKKNVRLEIASCKKKFRIFFLHFPLARECPARYEVGKPVGHILNVFCFILAVLDLGVVLLLIPSRRRLKADG